MIKGFWSKLKKPVFVLAPLADVTDASFRYIIAKYGKPDAIWTEFVSADAICSPGLERVKIDLAYDEIERPIIAQIFGAKPKNFYKAAQYLAEAEFDGIDINMGCPEKSIVKQGCGAALFKNPKLAQEIIAETRRGAPKLPVSVKIRLGDTKIDIEPWLKSLLQAELAAISIHLRTRAEMSKVSAHWEVMPEIMRMAKETISNENERPLIIGNGDIKNLKEAEEKVKETGCDGVMIGRGIFGNPWCFNRSRNPETIPLEETLRVMVEHTKLYEQMFKGKKSFELMKKHYKAYVNGFDGAKEIRMELMECENAEQVEQIIQKHFPKAL